MMSGVLTMVSVRPLVENIDAVGCFLSQYVSGPIPELDHVLSCFFIALLRIPDSLLTEELVDPVNHGLDHFQILQSDPQRLSFELFVSQFGRGFRGNGVQT